MHLLKVACLKHMTINAETHSHMISMEWFLALGVANQAALSCCLFLYISFYLHQLQPICSILSNKAAFPAFEPSLSTPDSFSTNDGRSRYWNHVGFYVSNARSFSATIGCQNDNHYVDFHQNCYVQYPIWSQGKIGNGVARNGPSKR